MAVINEIAHLMENRIRVQTYEEILHIYFGGSFFKHLMPIWRGTKDDDSFTYTFAHIYKFENYYVVVESCDGCYGQFKAFATRNLFDEIIERNISKSYVVDTYEECIEYVNMKQYIKDED